MKRWVAFGSVVLVVSGAIVWSEVNKVEAPVGPEPILNLVADGQRELTRLPVAFTPLAESEEIKIGKQLESLYLTLWRPSGQEDQNRAIEKYVQQVGSRVAANAHRKLPYKFHYIPDLDFINAFALPGGPVFIGEGLMALMDSEDELAAVLGHEIEHIDHFHCAERIQVEATLRRTPLGGLVGLPVEIFVAGYSKNQELEADREGTRLATAASYSPGGAIRMFEAFERVYPTKSRRSGTPQEELSEIALKTLEGYFRSHPLNQERIDQVQKMIAGGQLPAWSRMTPLPVAYLFLTERAWRSLQLAQVRPYTFLTEKERRKREGERVKQYEEAGKLASQSLDRKPDQPRAIEIVAVSKFALGDYAAAAAAYHKLLPDNPTFADGVRVYADTLAQQALEAQQYEKAKKLAMHSLELQPNQAEALKTLAEAQFWMSDFTGASDTCRKLNNMYTQTADEVRIYADQLAVSQWAKHRYHDAAGVAALSLELKPGQRDTLTIMAKAQFASANFSAAAVAYRKLLDEEISDIELVRGYTDSLSATNLAPQAAHEFQAWHVRARPASPAVATQLRIELAGLMLMAGDETPAKAVVAEAKGADGSLIAPEFLGRLGWWYYRAGKYETAREVLSQSVALRPGDPKLLNALAWAELQQHHMERAIPGFNAAAADSSWNSPIMGRAIAHWRNNQAADALKDFDSTMKTSPEWNDPHWVKALFPVSVGQSVAEMGVRGKRSRLLAGFCMRIALIIGFAVAAVLALFLLPPIPQDSAYHNFADQRTFWGTPNFWNVTSNLPFLLVAIWGLRTLRSRSAFQQNWERTAYCLLLTGVAFVAFGSAYYHFSPNNTTLFWDRLPMTIAFMSLLATTIGERISMRAGQLLLFPLIAIGVASVLYWRLSSDLRPYVLVQFVPMITLPLMVVLLPPRYTGTSGILGMIGFYTVAKILELFDRQIGEILATGGHPWKHIAGALAILCYVNTVARRQIGCSTATAEKATTSFAV